MVASSSRHQYHPILLLLVVVVVHGQPEKPELSFGIKAPSIVSSKSFWGGPLQPSLQFTKCATVEKCDVAVRNVVVSVATRCVVGWAAAMLRTIMQRDHSRLLQIHDYQNDQYYDSRHISNFRFFL